MKETKSSMILTLLVTFLQTSYCEVTQYPQTRCSLDDSACLTKQAQETLKTFVDGIPELGVQKLDKFPIDPLIVAADNFFFNWTDITAAGLKDAIIDDVTIDMEVKTMRVSFHTDIFLEFYSTLDGVLLSVLPVYGTGRGNLTLKTMKMEILFVFDIIKDDSGKDVMDLKTYYYAYDPAGGVTCRLENLYDGDKEKSDQLHKLANRNWRIMVNNFGSSFQRKITNKIFDAVKLYMRSRPLEELALYKGN